jgi:MraZ protein
MFMGQYSHTLDAKGRLTIPKRYRAELADGLVITQGNKQYLVIHPATRWTMLAEKTAQMPLTSESADAYRRQLYTLASEVTLDTMGRILIPAFLREFAKIEQDVIIAGVNTYIEIWSPEAWRETCASEAENRSAILAEVTRMGI